MDSQCPAVPLAASPRTGGEPADILMLLRATNLKMLRLQLAIERQDRPVVLAAVDDLVALDRRLQDYLAAGTRESEDRLMFRRELEQDRALLNREKLTLAAEVLRRPPSSYELTAKPPGDEREAQEEWVAEGYGGKPRRMLVAVPVLATAAAVAAYFVGLPDLRPWLAAGGLG